ncbi:FdhF/YdeP family oxidoreductase [Hymenobacter busanensis]|uniref:FdhF/YdeP family oxidoreductase n=1 Tax=Hymenobacter busanensis TaxID=2607656 RepID=UPI001F2AD80D|nr:FdhF/YdeP family oxidoreductase [Hymenobacter busanensis]
MTTPITPAAAPDILAQPPADLTGLRLSEPPTVAAGLEAVLQSMRFAWREAGLVRGTRAYLKLNQRDGFDCSSCAWPDPDDHRSIAEFCENGAKATASEATTHRADAALFARQSVAELSHLSDKALNDLGRFTEPLVLRPGATHYAPIGWKEAFELIGKELNALASPEEAVFYTSGRTSNEAAFMYQLFVRQFGTNNLPDCSNMCHESSGAALNSTIGIGKGTVKLEDLYEAEVILIVGQNPGTNHPRMLTALQRAKANGAQIVTINPLFEAGLNHFRNPQDFLNPLQAAGALFGPGTALTDVFLQVKINGDLPAFKGLCKALLEAEKRNPGQVVDHAFIGQYAVAGEYEALRTELETARWADIEEQSGLTETQLRDTAALLARSERIITCWAMGLTQHKNSVATIQEVVNLHLLRGAIGKPGAGLCPVRGHSNVQGDRTMGIWEKMPEEFLAALDAEFQFTAPRKQGYDTVQAIEALRDGRALVFIGMGGNFLSATPDTEATAAALRRCRLTVQVSTKPNRGHLVTGATALILPALARTDVDRQRTGAQFVTTENSMGVVQDSHGQLVPLSEHMLSEPAIVAGMALATLGTKSTVDWVGLVENYDRIREHIARVVPGCQGYNEQVRQPNGFYLPNGPRERRFTTTDGRAHFTVNPLQPVALQPGQLLMMTIRSHDQFNTTVYGLDDRYRGVKQERRVVFMHPADIEERGLYFRQPVDLISHFEGQERRAASFLAIPYDVPRGCCATYFPEANVLVPLRSVAERSNTPTSKSVVVTVQASAG